jgi:hypothetical protein
VAEDELNNSAEQVDVLSGVLPDVISAFRKLNDEGREKLLTTIATIFGLRANNAHNAATSVPMNSPELASDRFSKDRPIFPKEFLVKKEPHTDVERVACLAYYLTQYREQPHFKTLDISKLNTEAAQVKFTNAANVVNNATTYGYLAPATKGNKQISASGERFVEALPDREAARAVMANARPRRRSRRTARKES